MVAAGFGWSHWVLLAFGFGWVWLVRLFGGWIRLFSVCSNSIWLVLVVLARFRLVSVRFCWFGVLFATLGWSWLVLVGVGKCGQNWVGGG